MIMHKRIIFPIVDENGYSHTGAHSGYSSKTIYNPEMDFAVTFFN